MYLQSNMHETILVKSLQSRNLSEWYIWFIKENSLNISTFLTFRVHIKIIYVEKNTQFCHKTTEE